MENWPLFTKGKEQQKKEADQSRMVCGRFKKQRLKNKFKIKNQGNKHMRCVLGVYKISISPHLLARILKVYIQALTRFSHVCCPDGLNNTLLSSGHLLENDSHCGNGGQNINSKDRGRGVELLIAWVRLVGQLEVMPSQLASPTFCLYHTTE